MLHLRETRCTRDASGRPRRGDCKHGAKAVNGRFVASLKDWYPGATSFSTGVPANPRLSRAKGCHWYQPALRVLRIPVWYQTIWYHPFPQTEPQN